MTNKKTHFLNFGKNGRGGEGGLEERIIIIIVERGVSSKLWWKSKIPLLGRSFFFFIFQNRPKRNSFSSFFEYRENNLYRSTPYHVYPIN